MISVTFSISLPMEVYFMYIILAHLHWLVDLLARSSHDWLPLDLGVFRKIELKFNVISLHDAILTFSGNVLSFSEAEFISISTEFSI